MFFENSTFKSLTRLLLPKSVREINECLDSLKIEVQMIQVQDGQRFLVEHLEESGTGDGEDAFMSRYFMLSDLQNDVTKLPILQGRKFLE